MRHITTLNQVPAIAFDRLLTREECCDEHAHDFLYCEALAVFVARVDQLGEHVGRLLGLPLLARVAT